MKRKSVFRQYIDGCALRFFLGVFAILFLGSVNGVWAASVHILAAENMYGNIAQQIGGNYVHVEVILSNPDQDPHLFELTPRLSQKISHYDLVIMNGLGYDAWLGKLVSTVHFPVKNIISIQGLLNRPEGSNPHLWYDLQSAQVLSRSLVQKLSVLVPEQKELFLRNQQHFLADIQKINQCIEKIRALHRSISIAATEPVFGLMAKNMGFTVLETPYQWAMMNGGEPTPKQMAQFIQDIETRRMEILFYNNQVSNETTEHLKQLAQQYKIPVIGVEEIMPASISYQEWLSQTVKKVEAVVKSVS